MWINLDVEESIINLDLTNFDDFENDNWEYLFWHEQAEEGKEDLVEQSLLYSDSVGNIHDSMKRIKNGINPGFKKQISRNFMKKETQKSEFSNLMQEGKESPNKKSMSRNLTILRRNMSKRSSKNYFSSQSIQEIEEAAEEEKKKEMSQSSLNHAQNSSSNLKKKNYGIKTKNIARVLHDNQRKDLKRINKNMNEFLFLMENPHSWVNKLEIDYKDYARGRRNLRQFDGENYTVLQED